VEKEQRIEDKFIKWNMYKIKLYTVTISNVVGIQDNSLSLCIIKIIVRSAYPSSFITLHQVSSRAKTTLIKENEKADTVSRTIWDLPQAKGQPSQA
jgi:hypothetical protein